MPRRFCHSCKGSLHAADSHGESSTRRNVLINVTPPLAPSRFLLHRSLELTSAQPPRASPCPQREDSPVLFARPDLDLVSFGGSEDDMLDSMSLAASDTEELLGSVNDPAPLPIGTGMDAELFRVLTRAVNELGLEWSPLEEPSHSLLDSLLDE
ncbi:hypothetical protein M9458_052497 [Cirrhinus mrigala]|uniref:Uncharacterized protein n=1 Tax=Cirrhinus mrigala TaxID=683832 RepID=A0ABD0MRV4_CIRMR